MKCEFGDLLYIILTLPKYLQKLGPKVTPVSIHQRNNGVSIRKYNNEKIMTDKLTLLTDIPQARR